MCGSRAACAKLLREGAEVDPLVDAAVALEEVEARVLDKVALGVAEEEVGVEQLGAVGEARLRRLEVAAHVEVLEEERDRVRVLVALEADRAHELLEEAAAPRVGDDGDGEVAEEVGAVRLQRVEVLVLEEEVGDDRLARRVVAEQEE